MRTTPCYDEHGAGVGGEYDLLLEELETEAPEKRREERDARAYPMRSARGEPPVEPPWEKPREEFPRPVAPRRGAPGPLGLRPPQNGRGQVRESAVGEDLKTELCEVPRDAPVVAPH